MYKNHGVKGIYKGFVVCALREGCTFASYFGTYNYLTNLVKPEGGTTKDIAAWKLMICGGLTGFAYWGPWYPIDIVKSKLQADSLANPRYKGAIDCA